MYTTTDSFNQFMKYFSVYISLVCSISYHACFVHSCKDFPSSSNLPATFSNIIDLIEHMTSLRLCCVYLNIRSLKILMKILEG
jgi:hypothetical protein